MTEKSYTAMLSEALESRARWLDMASPGDFCFSDRDLLSMSLIAQIWHADTIVFDDQALVIAVSRAILVSSGPGVCAISEIGHSGQRICILVEQGRMEAAELARLCDIPDSLLIVYGLRGRVTTPAGSPAQSLSPLAMLNPSLWNSGLALFSSSANAAAVDAVASQLGAILGDQCLDPLALYEENCQFRQKSDRTVVAVDGGQTAARAGPAQRQLIALRRFVQGQIEQAVFAAQAATARNSPTATIDWDSVFLPSIASEEASFAIGGRVDDSEARARRARTEAEFLRVQLRSYTIARDVDHLRLVAASGFFDVDWYASTYDVQPQVAVRHYLDQGAAMGYDPSPIFSTKYYYTSYPDVAKHGFNPLVHYLMDGIYEGRMIDPPPSLSEETWAEGFSDID